MQILRIMGILALAISFLLSAGSVQEAWEDNNDKYFFMYALLMVCSMGGFIYLVN
ncbi:MAG: hypothetical protein GX309_13100 [Clostridiales bacterium]|nr:hypothetical protein [Clostridiales bacterium]